MALQLYAGVERLASASPASLHALRRRADRVAAMLQGLIRRENSRCQQPVASSE